MRQRRGLSATVVTLINQSCSSSNKLIKRLQILKGTPTSPSTIHSHVILAATLCLMESTFSVCVQRHYVCEDIIYQIWK